MNRMHRSLRRAGLVAALLIAAALPATASVPAQVGPYRVQISTEPGVIPVGKARLRIEVTDATGRPIERAQVRSLVKMASMSMGERETVAQPIPGEPGVYTSEASFAMAGAYEASIAIRGPLGDAAGRVALETGQNTEASPGVGTPGARWWLAAAAAALLVVFVAYRMKATGQRVAWRSVVHRGTIGGALALVAAYAASRYAIDHWRRPGAMTPIEAQGMEMNTPPPPGVAPVILAEAARGLVERTVSYPGQAIAFNEQDVSARTEGWLNWMPYYTGQSVQAGQIVARLDINLLHAHLGEREAAVDLAVAAVQVNQRARLQALAETDRARAELRARSDALGGAEAEVTAAREERAAAVAALASRQSMITDAEAMLAAAEADGQFWRLQDTRNKTLLDRGALSLEEYQRDSAMAANAAAKVRQAQSRLAEAQANVRAAEAAIRKADAMIAAAEKRRLEMTSSVTAAEAAVRSAETFAEVADAKISESRAGEAQARSSLEITTVTHEYADIPAQFDGVVTARFMSPGQLVSPGQAILRVAQVDPIRLQANVAEVDLARIRVGNTFVVRGQGGASPPLVARVTTIPPTVDPATRTGVIEAVAPNRDRRFTPGQFISAEISTGRSEDALRVPVAAVHTKTETGEGVLALGGSPYVWLAEPDGADGRYRVRPVDVVTGLSDGVYVEIVSGLEPGQQVVAAGAEYLKRGDAVAAAGKEAR
ncbi:MAG TPA: efflux RND transporter periplasmic adaptor subunit [Terriglobia bacterium]|nr:efflux RND transporter periplasmic adaptor subunit [Terriglobia bacterium]